MILLGTCTRLNARITERQCHINQGIPHLPCRGCSGLEDTASSDYQPPVTAADTNNTSDTSTPQKEDTMSNKRITCKTCKRKNLVLAAAGECGRCYGRRKAGKDPLTNKPISAINDTVELLSIQKPAESINNEQSTQICVSETPPPPEHHLDAPPKADHSRKPRPYPTPENVTLSFITSRDSDLFGKLQAMAAAHRRTLEAEILFQLEEQVMQIETIYMSNLSILDN